MEIVVYVGASEAISGKMKDQGEFCGSSCQKREWVDVETTLLFILFFCFAHPNILLLSPVSFAPSLSFLDP